MRLYTIDWALAVGPLAAAAFVRTVQPTNFPEQSSWLQPPSRTFAVVWTVIYALFGAFLTRARRASNDAFRWILPIALINLAVNLTWPARVYGPSPPNKVAGYYEIHFLSLTVLSMMVIAGPDRVAQLLLVPYLVWLQVASGLVQTATPSSGPRSDLSAAEESSDHEPVGWAPATR